MRSQKWSRAVDLIWTFFCVVCVIHFLDFFLLLKVAVYVFVKAFDLEQP